MHLNKVMLLVLIVNPLLCLHAQTGTVQRDPIDHSITNMKDAIATKDVTAYSLDNPNLALGRRADSINYDKVAGSPFWMEASHSALLYSGAKYVTTVPVRINFVTGEIYFTKDNQEMVLTNNYINTIVFQSPNDTTVFISQVPDLYINKKPADGFVQVLNTGKLQLLKYVKRRVASMESPSHISTSYYFTDDTYYFILANNKAAGIKKLNKENLFSLLPNASLHDAWIKENNINFKNEKEVVRFLNYYNTHTQ